MLEQLQIAVPPSVPPLSSFLSSEDDGDTEVLFTADYPSIVRFCEDGDDDDGDAMDKKDSQRIPGHLDWVATGSTLTRSRSLLGLSNVDSIVSQSGQLYRAKSYPQLTGHGDKHVRFRAGQVDSAYSQFSGIDDKSSAGIFSCSSKAQTVKSKEIYVNFSYWSTSKYKNMSWLPTTREDDEGSGSKEAGQLNPAEGDNSLTASATGEILGVSAVNSNDLSPDMAHPQGRGQGVKIEDLCEDDFSQRNNTSMLSTKSDMTLTCKSKSPPGGADQLSSLPDLTAQGVFPTIETDVATPAVKPHLRSGGMKTSPYRQHRKKHVTIPSEGPSELHESSVFSSTRYGPIVSAAESTTLSCAGSDVTDSGSSSSVNVTPVVENLSQW